MPTKAVLCIKIAQRIMSEKPDKTLPKLFPFERVYLCSEENLPALKKTYRYLLYAPTTPGIANALVLLDPTLAPAIGKHRETRALKQTVLSGFVQQYPYLCVPTSIRYVRTTNGTPKSRLCYHISKILRIRHSGNFEGFKLYLKTPGHSGAPICSWCSKVLEALDANCTPGTSSCVPGVITLPLDPNNFSKRVVRALKKGD